MITVWWKSSSGNNLADPWGTSTQNIRDIIEHVAHMISRVEDNHHRRPVESEDMVEYAREVLERGDFDEVSGTYAYFSGWHGGQSSWSYQALCVLGADFHPGMSWSESKLEESEIDAYNAAVEKFGGDPYEVEE